jgi:integrase
LALYDTGCRAAEFLSLNLGDIKLADGRKSGLIYYILWL